MASGGGPANVTENVAPEPVGSDTATAGAMYPVPPAVTDTDENPPPLMSVDP